MKAGPSPLVCPSARYILLFLGATFNGSWGLVPAWHRATGVPPGASTLLPFPPGRLMKEKPDQGGGGRPPSLELPGTLTLFGFPPEKAVLRVLPRTRAWRGARALGFLGGGILLAPLVGVIPPHAPWAAGVLGISSFLGIRRWRERFTLESLHARCPRCGRPIDLKRGTPLRPTTPVPCDDCHHESQLTVRLPREHPQVAPPQAEVPASGPAEAEGDPGGST